MNTMLFAPIPRKLSSLFALLMACILLMGSSAAALSPEQRKVMDSGVGYFNVEELDCNLLSGPGGGAAGPGLPAAIPAVWRELIAATAPTYPDTDPRLVASVLWAEHRGWPTYRTTGWAESGASAQGPWQFIPSSWASMGHDGDGDGVKDPNNPVDAVHAAFKHHAGSAGKPVAGRGFTPNGGAQGNFATTIFERNSQNLLSYAANYNGRGAPDGRLLSAFPDGDQNSDYVIMNYWLLASNFEQGFIPESNQVVDAKVTGEMFGSPAAGAPVGPGGNSSLTGNALCPGGAAAGGQLVGDMSWPMDKALYDTDSANWTDSHHDYPAVDIGVGEGQPVYAMIGGRIVAAPADPPTSGCGTGVVIDSGNGVVFSYCHGSDGGSVPGAEMGDEVQAGQLIMHSGNTGNSTGPHLHIGIKVNGQNRCPQTLFPGLANGSPPPIASLPSSGCTH